MDTFKGVCRRLTHKCKQNTFYVTGIFIVIVIILICKTILESYYIDYVNRHSIRTIKRNKSLNCHFSKPPQGNEILKRNGYYQYFINHKLNATNYFINVYYDDRKLLNTPLIRVNIATSVHYDQLLDMKACKEMETYIMFWYTNALSVSCQCMIIFSASRWEVNLLKYYISQWECHIPIFTTISSENRDHVYLPKYVSLMDTECKSKPTTYIPITIPNKQINAESHSVEKKVGLMMKGWFGNWTQEFAPYFVSWMESLKIFGIHHIFASKDALYLKDSVMQKLVRHYEHTGFLSLPTVPTNFEEVDKPHTSFSIDQIGTFLTVNDIFYKNMHRYWYLIHADIDEIIVPKIKSSYMSTLTHILEKFPKKHTSASIAAPMSLFYTDNEPDNKFSSKFPFFRQNYRQPVETMLRNGNLLLDAPKSFVNTRTCLLVGIHYCYFTYTNKVKQVEMDILEDVALVHHYRRSCKKYPEECQADRLKRFKDDYLYRTVGRVLENNIEKVLKMAGYETLFN